MRYERLFSLVLILALLAACSPAAVSQPTPEAPMPTDTAQPTPTPAGPEFRVVGYVATWDVVEAIPFDHLTHINYAFLIPNSDGTFVDLANAWKLKHVVDRAHAAGVKVLISVGGWGWDDEFEATMANLTYRQAFIDNLVKFVEDNQLDGADIDWEYPGPGEESARAYTEMMQSLRARLEPQGKLLTSAVVALGSTGDWISDEALATMDFVNIMAYDGPGADHSTMKYANAALDYWSARGLSPEKLVLGVPFYSRPSELTYREIIKADPAAAQVDEYDYYGTLNYYNGIPTMQAKTRLAMERASGIMIWTVAGDTTDETSLLAAIARTIAEQP